MWRPPLRCDDRYRTYVEELFQTTCLDRNQIMRAMMFTAPFDDQFRKLMERHQHDTSPLPHQDWAITEAGLWMEQTYEKKGGSDVNDQSESRRKVETISRVDSRSAATRGTREEPRRVRPVRPGGNGVTIKVGERHMGTYR